MGATGLPHMLGGKVLELILAGAVVIFAYYQLVDSAHDTRSCLSEPFDQLERSVQIDNNKAGSRPRGLVTGAAGFIGSWVTEHALRLGVEIVCVDDLSGGFLRNVPSGCTWVQGDVSNETFVDELWQHHGPFQQVYHLAAYAAEGLSHHIRRYNYENNLIASVILLNHAINHNVSTFVFTSSIAAFGTAQQLPMREHHRMQPEDPYGIAKYAFELDLRSAHQMFGIDFVIFRPHNVYGPRQNVADKFRNVVGIFINQIMRGEPMTIFGDGGQSRAFSHIADVAPYIAIAPFVPAAKNQDFFVGRDERTSVGELSGLVAAAMGVKPNVNHLPQRHEVVHAYAVHDKLRCVFNPRAPISLKEGLKQTAEYSKRLGSFEPTGYSKIEIPKNLPPSWQVALSRLQSATNASKYNQNRDQDGE